MGIDEVIKSFDGTGDLVLSPEQANALKKRMETLHLYSQSGFEYISDLREQIVKLFAIAQPELSAGTVKSITERMSVEELKAFKTACEKTAERVMPIKPQLSDTKNEKKQDFDKDYLI